MIKQLNFFIQNPDGMTIEEATHASNYGQGIFDTGIRKEHVAKNRADSILQDLKSALESQDSRNIASVTDLIRHKLSLPEHHLDLDHLNGQIICIKTDTSNSLAYVLKISSQDFNATLRKVNPQKRGGRFVKKTGFLY